MDFGDKLKQYRLKEGLSQEQLAEKIGVSRQAITKWETKRGLPDVENMIILAELSSSLSMSLCLKRSKSRKKSGWFSKAKRFMTSTLASILT